jgi:hypothetical protein
MPEYERRPESNNNGGNNNNQQRSQPKRINVSQAQANYLPQNIPPAKQKRRLIKSKKALFIGVIVVLLLGVAIGAATYFATKYMDANKEVERLSDPETAAKNEQDLLIAKIGALTPLPEGEVPTVATVTDKAKLADQPFFVNSEIDDKVLIYTEAKKAYLYRPSTNKIINIAPVNIGENEETIPGQLDTEE